MGQQPVSPAVCLLSGAIQPLVGPALLQDQRPPGEGRGADPAGVHVCGGGEQREADGVSSLRGQSSSLLIGSFITLKNS